MPVPFQSVGSIKIPIYGVAHNAFINRQPLFTRLPQAPLGALSFKTSTKFYRPRQTVLANGGATGSGATSFVVADASIFMRGDTIEIENEEYLVGADPVVSTNTLSVIPAWAGTTTASHADGLAVYLIGNSRTGSEINVNGISRIPTILTNYAQTFQHPWQIGGSLSSSSEMALPPGVASVIGQQRLIAIENCGDDIEGSIYYGRPVGVSSSVPNQAMAGLRSQIVTNHASAPTGFAAYTSAMLIRDTIQKVLDAGGNPDVLVMSTDWASGLHVWSQPLVRYEAGATKFGTSIRVFTCPFLNDIKLILAPLLRKGTVICLDSSEVSLAVKRPMFDKPRGSQGDADMGDIIFEGAVRVDQEAHHAWVDGITGFAAG
jgi:hypothetical protein